MALNKHLLLFLVTCFIFVSACETDTEVKMIQESFENYRSAILNRKGELAYTLVDINTKKYYEKTINMILHLSEIETKKLSLLNKVNVLMARHRIEPDVLTKMSGKSFFVYAVDNGWIGEESVSNLQIEVVEINDNFAKTHIVTEEGEAPFGFSFRREDGKWRIDLTSMFSISNVAFSKQAENMGVSENEFIFMILESISGKKVESKIWNPIAVN